MMLTGTAAIVARVKQMAPNQPAEQRRILERWARLLSGLEPRMAEALLDASLVTTVRP